MAGRFFGVPFALTGDRVVTPDPPQLDGSVSYEVGFGFDYERPNTDVDYKPIPRDGINGLFFDITEALGILQKQGAADWTSDAAPYPINAMVRHDDEVWTSLITNNNSTPAVGTDWRNVNALASTLLAGLVELATNAEMATGTDTARVPSVAAVMSIFAKRVFAGNDFIRIPDVPGGLIIQWLGVTSNTAAPGSTAFSWPIAFPNAFLRCVASEVGVNATTVATMKVLNPGLSGGSITHTFDVGSAAPSAHLFAIGN